MEPTKGLDKIVRSPVDNSYTLFVPEKSIGIHRAKGGNGPFAAAGHDHLRMGKERHHALEGLYAAASARWNTQPRRLCCEARYEEPHA